MTAITGSPELRLRFTDTGSVTLLFNRARRRWPVLAHPSVRQSAASSASASLLELLPDLVLLMRRDGSVLAHAGGHGVPDLRCANAQWQASWAETTAQLIRQLLRRSISNRSTGEARFIERGRAYEVRITPQGPDRALCVVRAVLESPRDEGLENTDEQARPRLDRRGFLRRFRESMSVATLREQALAVAVVHIDGIPDIAQAIASRVSEQVMSAAISRLTSLTADDSGSARWYLGQLGENVLALVLDTADRNVIEACVARLCENLREPIAVGDAEFQVTPYAGVGILGMDAASPKVLLEHARTAAMEARRTASRDVHFYSDTMQLQSLARLDLARELREAVSNRDIRFRYVGRYDLASGRLVARVAYLRWLHPLRGEIRPAQFLRLAGTTGLGVALSRAALKVLGEEFVAHENDWGPDVRVSFGALRDHIFHEDFLADVERMLAEDIVPARSLELRVSERAFIARDPLDFRPLQQRCVQLVVDEAGRGMSSLASLARSPMWGLQLDRAWTSALHSDQVAHKVCRAGISMATALGLTPMALGVDTRAQRDMLLEMGCRYGSGDFYKE